MTLAAAPSPRNASLIPTPVVIAAACLMAFAILFAGFGRLTGFGRVESPASTPYWTLQLRFEDRPDGSIAVRNADRGDVFAVIAPGTGGFVRATMRTFAQARKNDDLGAQIPFKLVRWRDGAITLEDTATNRSVELDAFGVDNAGAFAKMFAEREASR